MRLARRELAALGDGREEDGMKVKGEWTSVTQDMGLHTHIQGYAPRPQRSRLSLGNPISKA